MKEANKEEKIYNYKHRCSNCNEVLSVRFVYSSVIKKSVGYCIKCKFPSIVGRKSCDVETARLLMKG